MSNVKKMLGVFMAAMLCFALTPIAAFAADGDVTLSINKPVTGHTYKVYQMLTGDVTALEPHTSDKGDPEGASGTVQSPSRGENLKKDVTVSMFIDAVKDKSQSQLGNEVYGYITGNPVAELSVDKTSVTVAPGYYLIVDTGDIAEGDAASRFIVTVTGNTTISPKKDAPSLEKKIIDPDPDDDVNPLLDEGKTSTAAIGDIVEYELTSAVPNWEGYGEYKYIVNDELSAGLTLKEDSIVFVVGEKTLVKGTDYIFAKNGQKFTLSIADMKTLAGVNVGDSISVKYNATVNDNAAIGYDPNENTAWLQYSNNPSHSGEGSPNSDNVLGKTPDSVVKTYVSGLEITKFETIDGQKFALQGAEFTLTGSNLNKVIMNTETVYTVDPNGTWYKLKDGKYTTQEPNDNTAAQYESTITKYVMNTVMRQTSESVEGDSVKANVDEAGKLYYYGLNAGTYTLEESVVPDGYNGLDSITFTISATANDKGEISWSSNNEKIVLGDTGVFTAEIENMSGLTLPSTGGIGTTIFYIVGGILVVGAIAFLIVRRRANSTK